MRLATDLSKSVERLRSLGYSDRSILSGFEQARPRGNSLEGGAINHPPLLQRNAAKPAQDLITAVWTCTRSRIF